jgi:hypothetical protein
MQLRASPHCGRVYKEKSQIDRISEFNRILNRILFSKDGSPQWKMGYYGSTGVGAVIT